MLLLLLLLTLTLVIIIIIVTIIITIIITYSSKNDALLKSISKTSYGFFFFLHFVPGFVFFQMFAFPFQQKQTITVIFQNRPCCYYYYYYYQCYYYVIQRFIQGLLLSSVLEQKIESL